MSKKPESLDELISHKAEEFADQVRAAAAMADTEEEIRIEVEKQLAFVQKDAGVKLQGKHEFKLADSYGIPGAGVKAAELLFSVHTYYALFMKLLAGEIIGHFHKLSSAHKSLVTLDTRSARRR